MGLAQEILVGVGTGGLFVAFGLGMFAFYLMRRAKMRRAQNWSATDGVVVERTRDSAPSITVRYEDANGIAHETRSLGGSTDFPDVGQTTQIRYDPELPDEAVIDVDMRMGRGVALLLAAVFIGFGLFVMVAVLVG